MQDKTFHLGLCMAGAISAGAYTAGVVDYLLETLGKWEIEKQKALHDPEIYKDVPMHNVVISVMTGASAGGMTAIITSAALQNKIGHITPDRRNDDAYKKQNKLYDSWVNMKADNMLLLMLENGDIERDKVARSLLNSDFIENLANDVVQADKNDIVERNYINPNLELLVTLSNINGIPYKIGFVSEVPSESQFLTKAHNDFGHFMMMQDDKENKAELGQIPLSYKLDKNIDLARQCAMATGAFPVGLAQREVIRDKKFIVRNPFLNKIYNASNNDIAITDPFHTLNLDGGMINNEPFEYTRRLLCRNTKEEIQGRADEDTFKSCTLMVDPFPSMSSESLDIESSLTLLPAIKNIIGTMRSQLLFKPEDIEEALNENNPSRYLIAPKRIVGNNVEIGSKAIACGSLGGFGGFISKDFREHDYYLGRRNCQYFLRKIFTIPGSCQNPIFVEGYQNAEARNRFQAPLTGNLPIIPDMDCTYDNLKINAEPQANWPGITTQSINQYERPIAKRFEKVVNGLISNLKWSVRVLLKIGVFVVMKDLASRTVMNWIKKDLNSHNLSR